MVKVGIIGGTGYTAGELIRILLYHGKVEIDFVFSTSKAGLPVTNVHQDLYGDTELKFTGTVNPNVDVVFLCLGHGNSKSFLKDHLFSETTKVIDLSNDFRLDPDAGAFVYGLPESRKSAIQNAQFIANPGCFATAIQLALLPLAENGLLKSNVHINATTGATGAGAGLSATAHFTWRDNNFSHYKAFEHQHLDEIEQTLIHHQPEFHQNLYFIPNRGNFSRGIFATLYTTFDGTLEEAKDIYSTFYKDEPFVAISNEEIHLKQVVNTNKCLLHLKRYKDQLLITSCIDNLLKGASGQAVQNMNLMFGWPEIQGLQLKANHF